MTMAGAKVRRGDLVTVSLPGAYRTLPALVIQSDFFNEHPSVTILPITEKLRQTPLFRLVIRPSPENGLRKPSQVMVDKSATIPRNMIEATVGRLDRGAMMAVNRALGLFLGFA
jgi:mRNA interferase MazF